MTDVQGATTDAAWDKSAASATQISILKAIATGASSAASTALTDVWDSTNHFLKVSLVTALNFATDSILTYPFGHSNAVISTATTTVVKSGPGTALRVWTPGGTMGNVQIFDNTAASGTVLFPALTPVAGWVLLDSVAFGTGLTVVTSAATVVICVYR